MVEGAAYVGSWLYASRDMFVWGKPRGHNFLDSGSLSDPYSFFTDPDPVLKRKYGSRSRAKFLQELKKFLFKRCPLSMFIFINVLQ